MKILATASLIVLLSLGLAGATCVDDASVSLDWHYTDAALEAEIATQELHRADAVIGPYELVAELTGDARSTTATLPSEGTHFYTVFAVDAEGCKIITGEPWKFSWRVPVQALEHGPAPE